VDELTLSRYIEGRLDMADTKTVDELLRVNPAARRRLDALREEERLIREAMEALSEPSRRLGDKVIAALHAEERLRQQSARTFRVRRHVFATLAAAASLALCVWLVKPRDSMGTAVSGTSATVVTLSGERRPLTKDSRFYEGDQIITALGQFVRLRVASGTTLDLDECSKVFVEKARPAASFRLESGRMGVNAQADTVIHVPQGTVRAAAGTLLDMWLPRPADVVWPALFEPTPGGAASPVSQPGETGKNANPALSTPPAVVTVLSGTANIANERPPSEGIALTKATRVIFTRKTRVISSLDPAASRVIETRQGRTWHTLDGVSPQDRAVIGLLEQPDFEDVGRRLNMTANTPPAVAKAVSDALALLQNAAKIAPAAERAEKLAAGQQALRMAYASLKAGDEHRALGRLVEGLAHLERGRALMAVTLNSETDKATAESDRAAAAAAFDAARVALEEALGLDAAAPLPTTDVQTDWARQLAAGPSVTLRELSPANQASLLGTFNYALSRYWLARTAAPVPATDGAEAKQEASAARAAARDFDALRAALGRSVDALSARMAEGLALEAAANAPGTKEQDAKVLRGKAVEALEEVLATPLAGWSDTARRHGNGLRQATLLALIRTHLENHDTAQARAAAEDFRLLHPLDPTSPVAREIGRLVNAQVLSDAHSALQAGHYETAVEAYAEWLKNADAAGTTATALIPARLQLLKALIGLKDGERARQEAAALAGVVPADSKAELEALAKQAAALPAAAPEQPAVPRQ
jgi:hypothetical protein